MTMFNGMEIMSHDVDYIVNIRLTNYSFEITASPTV